MRPEPERLQGKLIVDLLRALLRVISLEVDGEAVRIDGFRLRRTKKSIIPPAPPGEPSGLEFQDMSGYRRMEPRLEMICRQVSFLAAHVDFLSRGQIAPVNGFSLKNLAHWRVASHGNPLHVIDHLAWSCKIKCSFCYLDGNPPEFKTRPERTSLPELRLRLEHFNQHTALFPRYISQNDETLTHPRVFEVLTALRKKTDRCFEVSTNGRPLHEENIRRLKALEPVSVNLSLTSADPRYRGLVAKDREPETAIRSLPLLKKHRIHYFTSIVAWPTLPHEDIEKTIRYISENEATHIGIYYPGYSRYFPPARAIRDSKDHWHQTINLVRRLRREVDTPLVLDIQHYEEIYTDARKNEVTVLGVIKNSPAFRGGLRWNDRVTEAGGKKIFFRSQLNKMLALLWINGQQDVELKVRRAGETKRLILKETGDDYPYRATQYPYGVLMYSALDTSHLHLLRNIIHANEAKRVLFLTSFLMHPSVEDLVRRWRVIEPDIDLTFAVPPNRFLGGNIFVGDLLVVQDYIDFLKEWLERNGGVDLVVIPATPFSSWGRDLTGRTYLDIEREAGVRVRLMPCERILG